MQKHRVARANPSTVVSPSLMLEGDIKEPKKELKESAGGKINDKISSDPPKNQKDLTNGKNPTKIEPMNQLPPKLGLLTSTCVANGGTPYR